MKKILLSVCLILGLTSCSKAQKKEFTPEGLSNTMKTTENVDITFQKILKQYEGKVVVVDVWASWCSDCLKGMPKLKALQEKYPDAIYLFISMDKNYEDWIKGIEKYDVQGEHYLTSDGMKGVFGKSIDLDWIPRYMVVDKNGKIALYRAIEADDKKIEETLESLK